MGKITTISGPMYAGKTTRLIELFRKERNNSKMVIKPKIDNRYSLSHVVSHKKDKIIAERIGGTQEFIDKTANIKTIFIDEFQFFSLEIAEKVCEMASKGKEIYISGLNFDFRGNPFETVKFIMKHSDHIEILCGKCFKCNNPSTYTFRTNQSNELVLIGEKQDYQALCSSCFNKYKE